VLRHPQLLPCDPLGKRRAGSDLHGTQPFAVGREDEGLILRAEPSILVLGRPL